MSRSIASARRTPEPWMAEAGLLARQEAELRAIVEQRGLPT